MSVTILYVLLFLSFTKDTCRMVHKKRKLLPIRSHHICRFFLHRGVHHQIKHKTELYYVVTQNVPSLTSVSFGNKIQIRY